MRAFGKHIGNFIGTGYTVFYILVIFIVLVFMPIMSIADGIKIIKTGYTVTSEYFSVIIGVLFFTYLSLRFRCLRKMYKVLPFLFETVKFLIITNMFIVVGVEILNWSYITINSTRHKIGIVAFIFSLVLWRVFISMYYFKKPLISFMPKNEEKMQNYSEKA